MKKLLIFWNVIVLLLSGCAAAFSPPIANTYVPFYPDTAYLSKNTIGIKAYYWPYDRWGTHLGDSLTMLFDIQPNAITLEHHISLTSSKTYRIDFNPFFSFGALNVRTFYDTAALYSFIPYGSMALRFLPRICTKYVTLGLEIVPIGIGALPGTLTYALEMYNFLTAYSYFTFYPSSNTILYMGPSVNLLANTPSATAGIVYFKNKRERLRVGLSTGYYSDWVYRELHLFPWAGMVSIYTSLY